MPSGNEYYQNASEPVIDLYREMETDLLDNIAKKLGSDKSLINKIDIDGNTQLILDWQAQRLAELGLLTRENAKIISKLSGLSESQVDDIFKNVVDFQTKGTEAAFQDALQFGAALRNAVPIDESVLVQQILNSAIRSTNTTFNAVNLTMLDQASASYRQAVNAVSAQVLAGTKSATQALNEVVSKMADEGITGFVATNGSKYSAESYAAMLMRSNTKNTVTAIQEQRAIEYGNDYIEVNAYTGARPKCAVDQGLIYSRSGNTEPIEDLDGMKISVLAWSGTSFGEPDGILGINCGHQRFDFIPGFSTQDKEKVNQRENDKEYKEKQLQRKYERDIRNAKREKSMLESAKASPEAIQKAQSKITREQTKMREFINKTDRTRRPARERIGVPQKQTVPRAKPKPTPELTFKTKKDLPFKVNLNKMDDDFRKLLEDDILVLSNKYPEVANNLVNGFGTTKQTRSFGWFQPGMATTSKAGLISKNKIAFTNVLTKTDDYLAAQANNIKNFRYASQIPNSPVYTLWHEFGHAIDDAYLRFKNSIFDDTLEAFSGRKIFSSAEITAINKANFYVGKNSISGVIKNRMVAILGIERKEFIRQYVTELGTYAIKTNKEWFAEAFAQFNVTPAANRTDFQKLFGQVFDEVYNEALGGK